MPPPLGAWPPVNLFDMSSFPPTISPSPPVGYMPTTNPMATETSLALPSPSASISMNSPRCVAPRFLYSHPSPSFSSASPSSEDDDDEDDDDDDVVGATSPDDQSSVEEGYLPGFVRRFGQESFIPSEPSSARHGQLYLHRQQREGIALSPFIQPYRQSGSPSISEKQPPPTPASNGVSGIEFNQRFSDLDGEENLDARDRRWWAFLRNPARQRATPSSGGSVGIPRGSGGIGRGRGGSSRRGRRTGPEPVKARNGLMESGRPPEEGDTVLSRESQD